jgi:5-methylcytosine-specific restriction protein A
MFNINQIYKRADIHIQYGGNTQSGISSSAKFPFIFIFSGESGHQHGYKDQWENPDVFSYTGEGQLNDMRFIKGNLALRDHLKSGKRVFLFIQIRKAFVRYETELELIEFGYYPGDDREGNKRTAIKFFFKRSGKQLNYSPNDLPINLASEDELLVHRDTPTITERKGLVTSRVGQGAYRKSILYRWEFKCAITNYNKMEILIASHIVPWKDSTNDERLDVHNGILLSPNYDALFDQHFISFENNGKIILSDLLTKTNYNELGVTGKERINNLRFENSFYLDRHRNILK